MNTAAASARSAAFALLLLSSGYAAAVAEPSNGVTNGFALTWSSNNVNSLTLEAGEAFVNANAANQKGSQVISNGAQLVFVTAQPQGNIADGEGASCPARSTMRTSSTTRRPRSEVRIGSASSLHSSRLPTTASPARSSSMGPTGATTRASSSAP